ncbi:MAG: lipocalin family protein [Lentimicrobium sp.]|nr:lipocalin family protein [Lentimicrobium sp.]
MSQNAKLLFVLKHGLTFIFSACKKDKEDDNPPIKNELLTALNWRMTANSVSSEMPVYDEDGNITGYSGDEYAQMETCFKDDLTKFDTDLTVNFGEGATKCDDNDPQTVSGTWAFKSSETMLAVNEDGCTRDVNILELSASILKLQYSSGFGSETYTFAITLMH